MSETTTRTVTRNGGRLLMWLVFGLLAVLDYAWGFVRCRDLWDLYDVAYAKGNALACLKVKASVDEETGPRWKGAIVIAFGLCLLGWGAVTRLPTSWLIVVVVALVAALIVVGANIPVVDDDEAELTHMVLDGEIVEGDIVAPPWPGANGGTSIIERDPVPIGHADGAVVAVRLNRHILVGGQTGSGKSELIKVILAACALDPTTTLHVWSFKSAGDFTAFEPVCATFGGGRDSATIAAAVEMLAWLADVELPRRERDGWSGRVVMVLDETQILLSHHEHGADARRHLGIITQVGRSAGVVVIVATQRPSKISVPPEISDQLEVRIGLKVHGGPSNRLIFGESADSLGLRSDLIIAPGVAWLDDDGPTLITGWLLDPATIAATVARAGAARLRTGSQPSRQRESHPAIEPPPSSRLLPAVEYEPLDTTALDAAIAAWEADPLHPDNAPGTGRERDRTGGPPPTQVGGAPSSRLLGEGPASDQQDAPTELGGTPELGACPACGAVPPVGRTYCDPACRKRASRQRRCR